MTTRMPAATAATQAPIASDTPAAQPTATNTEQPLATGTKAALPATSTSPTEAAMSTAGAGATDAVAAATPLTTATISTAVAITMTGDVTATAPQEAPILAVNPGDLPPTGVDLNGGAWSFLIPLLLVIGLFAPSLARKARGKPISQSSNLRFKPEIGD
jgi:hypothetical protein